jgi:hypothetical protein
MVSDAEDFHCHRNLREFFLQCVDQRVINIGELKSCSRFTNDTNALAGYATTTSCQSANFNAASGWGGNA